MKAETTYYCVAQIKDGTPHFSIDPVLHTSEDSAKAECERLANLYKGKSFGYFKFVAKCTASSVVWSK